jgi:hypothetical protein
MNSRNDRESDREDDASRGVFSLLAARAHEVDVLGSEFAAEAHDAMKRTRTIVERTTREEAEELRDDLEQLLAWRALRCVGALPAFGATLRKALAREREAGAAAERIVSAVAGRTLHGGARLDVADFTAWLRDCSDSARSYDRLRQFALLMPRPPRLPSVGDWEGRAEVLAWVRAVLRDHDLMAS